MHTNERFITCQAGRQTKLTLITTGVVEIAQEPWVENPQTNQVFGTTKDYLVLLPGNRSLICPDCPQNGCKFTI